ncbi:MAG: peptide ABC transporter substrate-binding protein [Lentisphaeraceae bacterium]|nr:peptide ABC transporter substrate-binding protein [Lentisphaeraceae bacterium]
MRIINRFAVLFILLLISSCSEQGNGVDFNKRSVSVIIAAEPPTLSTVGPVSSIGIFFQGHIFEGLLRYDENNKLSGGVAEKWEITPEGATFHLRKNAKWSDGRVVTAHDFIYAWRLGASPENEYNFITFPMKNASKIAEGKLTSDKLGVTAVDDFTLKVDFEAPCAYFPALTTFTTYMPIRQDSFEKWGADKYAVDPEKMFYNGPFVLTEWKHGVSLKMTKNNYYWDKEKIWLNEINVPAITDQSTTRFNMFISKDVCMVNLEDSNSLKSALKRRLETPMKSFSSGFISYLEFNNREGRPTANKNLRKAISLVINRSDIVNKVLGIPGYKPGSTMFPSWLGGYEKLLHEEYDFNLPLESLSEAQKYLALAKEELGMEEITLTYLYSGGPSTDGMAVYIQEQLMNKLGIKVNLDKQIFKIRIAKSLSGEFDFLGGGWGPDYNDPMTFGDLLASWNQNNRGKFKNEKYDALVVQANNSVDQKERMDCFYEMHKILHEEVPVFPIFESGGIYLADPRLKGFFRNIIGSDPQLTYARIEEDE